MKKSDEIIFIVGPTAIGKSDVAFSMAKTVAAEIVSCDSMQIYREVNIASNKPSVEMLQSMKHYFIDIVSVEDEYNVGLYHDQSMAVIEDILARGKTPIITGGSGLYMQVLLDGIFKGQGANSVLRQELDVLAEEKGVDYLHQRLNLCDPVAAQKIHPNDKRRLIRALEVFEAGKIPISERQKEIEGLRDKAKVSVFCLNMERQILYDRINRRVDMMFDQGLLAEVKKIQHLKMSKTARSIIGVKEIQGFLAGQYDLLAAKELMCQNTRRLAKRQLTWFRRDKSIHWVEIQPDESADVIAQCILQKISDERKLK